MSYQILLLNRALDEFGRLSNDDYESVRDAMLKLAQEPRPAGCLRVIGRSGWHMQVGKYRVIYEIDDDKQHVTVLHIGRRRNIGP
jgi:mRNA interferase RelE/StbE